MKKIFGIPKEIKQDETRVALTPDAVGYLTSLGAEVFVEEGAGNLSYFNDSEYEASGAKIVKTAREIWDNCSYIIKVKEPQDSEIACFKEGQLIFSYMHLAVNEKLTQSLLDKKICTIASESVRTPDGKLPLLRPMSEVAGRISIQLGARYLEVHEGGRGILLGGVPGVHPGKVVIIGGGNAGINAAHVALGMGADVSILDNNQTRLAEIDLMFDGRIKTIYANPTTIDKEARKADILVGTVLIPNKKAPKIVREETVRQMKKGSVIIDISIDQGGIVETIDRLTSYSEPVFEKYGVLHCAIPNLPSAVPQTSSLAYSNAIIPYVQKIAELGEVAAIRECEPLRLGVNTFRGAITCEELAQSLQLDHTEISLLVGFSV